MAEEMQTSSVKEETQNESKNAPLDQEEQTAVPQEEGSATTEQQTAETQETIENVEAQENGDDGKESVKTEKKRKSSFYARAVDFCSKRVVRNVFALILVALSVVAMFMLDDYNVFRDNYLSFLNDSFVQKFMSIFGLQRFDTGLYIWYAFLCIVSTCVVLIIANMFLPMLSKRIYGKHQDKFKSEKSAKRIIALIYYGTIIIICAIIVCLVYMLGAFASLKPENTIVDALGIIKNFAHTMLLFTLFVILVPVIISIVFYVLKAIYLFFAWAIYSVKGFIVDIETHEEKVSSRAKMRRKRKVDEAKELKKASGGEGGAGNNGGNGGGGGFGGKDAVIHTKQLDPDRDKDIFPILVKTDKDEEENPTPKTPEIEITLDEFVRQFQSYAINHRKIYYELPVLRSFLAGLATSRLLILEGLSGTGKSMMPRMFSEFTGSDLFFAPVQSTWRDKTDVLGYYSEFTKIFRTKDFLNRLYTASYKDKTNLMILDEMNLSRIEYYFADFLSVLEYPPKDWKVKVIDSNVTTNLPKRLGDGYVQIPENTWFIGTANTDDSTFTITDKVYDRAIVLTFNERFSKISSDYKSDPINISADQIVKMFNEAKADEKFNLDEEETNKFLKLCDFIREQFDIRFGNRIMNQINTFVPVYVALGGKKEEALDFMLARKILRKLNGIYDDYIKEGIVLFTKYLNAEYGKGVFVETEQLLAKIMKRLV